MSKQSSAFAESEDQLAAICRQLYAGTLAPRFQVLVTQGFVELLVNAVIDAKCKNAKKITGNARDFPYSIKLLLLNELGLLPDGLYRTLNQLRKLRNDAAHDPFFEISEHVLVNGNSKRWLHEFCIQVICDFHNQHQSVLGPIFAPTLISGGGGIVVFPSGYRVESKSADPTESK